MLLLYKHQTSGIFFGVYVCMVLCMWVYVHASTMCTCTCVRCACVRVWVWRSQDNLRCHSSDFLPSRLRQDLSLARNFVKHNRLASELPGMYLSSPLILLSVALQRMSSRLTF